MLNVLKCDMRINEHYNVTQCSTNMLDTSSTMIR